MTSPKYLEAGKGELVWLLGEPRTFKVTTEETGGAFLQFESTHGPGMKVLTHLHHEEDEAFYVLAGQYEILIGETRFVASPGAFAFVPRDTIHGFTNMGQDVGRMLITVTPGTQHEGLFREVSALTERIGKPPSTAQLVALATQYGWVMASTK